MVFLEFLFDVYSLTNDDQSLVVSSETRAETFFCVYFAYTEYKETKWIFTKDGDSWLWHMLHKEAIRDKYYISCYIFDKNYICLTWAWNWAMGLLAQTDDELGCWRDKVSMFAGMNCSD